MNISRIFILRPIATSLLMLAILLSGMFAYRLLPQSALPEVDYPTIQVLTSYPGASPDVVATGVTAPLERQFGAMTGLTRMSSSSSASTSVITLQFALDVTLDVAEQYVQAAINAAANYLPPDLPVPPIFSKVNPADAPILTFAVSSDTLPLTVLQDLVETQLAQKLSQVSGVGLVSLGGGQRPAVRVKVNPAALAAYRLGFDDVRQAVSAANSNQAKGNFDGAELSVALDANSQLKTAAEYREQIITIRNGQTIRLNDVATVEDGAEDIYLGAWSNQQPAILVNVQRQPGANVIEVVERIRKLLPTLHAALPASVDITLLTDRTDSIRSSIKHVQFELMLAIALVVMVIFLFLRTFAATLIPSLAVPLSLVGTFGVMYLAGFSINNLTLMALTIATGFVVDDAIVMIENIARHMERSAAEGKPLSPMEAALTGARQIGFTIISLTFSLIAVLIPLLFMGDVVGRLFREFAMTLAIAILISAVVSLTLTPMLCARLLKHQPLERQGRFQRHSHALIERLIRRYGLVLQWVLARQPATLLVAAATMGLTVLLAWTVPKGFFPIQDTGLIQAVTEAPQSVSFSVMAERQQELAAAILQDPDVENVSSVVGIDGQNITLNSGRLLIRLKPKSARSADIREVMQRLHDSAGKVDGISLVMQPVQNLTVETRSSPTQYQYVLESLDEEALETWTPRLVERLRELPQLSNVGSTQKNQGRKAYVEVDRDSAGRLGVDIATIDDALYSAFGQRFVSTIFTQTSQYRVVLEADRAAYQGLGVFDHLYVTSSTGRQVPLSSIARIVEQPATLAIYREDQFAAHVVYFDVAPGHALGDATSAIREAEESLGLPSAIEGNFQGAAMAFTKAMENELILVLAAVVSMYIVLGILYESYIHPLTILSTLPSAGVGALLALMLTGNELSVVAIIGIVLLIGIVQKNAIMMIDFALETEHSEGRTAREAIYQACLLRFRPILMTTLAALFSAVPLVIGSGSGSELRQPLGIVMIGGLLLSQVLTLFTTPVIYLALDRLAGSIRGRGRKAAVVAAGDRELP